MKYLTIVLICIMLFFHGRSQQASFKKYPVYTGSDLGLQYSPTASTFIIWSPDAQKAQVIFYEQGVGGETFNTVDMQKEEKGIWSAKIEGNLKGRFYVFRVMIKDKWMDEVPDPYAKSVGVNGRRAMVADLRDTDPNGWNKDKSPEFKNATDAVIYELHVRDASIDKNSGIKEKGKFLGLTETGTKNNEGLSTGLDHIKELGITHVHLLPCFDFNSIDESDSDKAQYNWGYDPLNYNVPEGSYVTNAEDGITRIKEFKQLIKTFHENGLRVVMDVVYNHTSQTEKSNFNQLVPGYYYRHNKDGSFSDATACGNEVASERPMMRKFILESVKYWVNEYHIDGFRFDLMGVHDIETMNIISAELHKLKPGILLYGEGWTAKPSPYPDSLRALKKFAYKLDSIAVFSDDIRDGIKGNVFEYNDRGFATGKQGMEESIKFGVAAACKHYQVNYKKVNYSKAPYAKDPGNVITYASCHDNHTLWDKIEVSAKGANEADKKEMQKLALSIVLTSQGIPFLHAGSEFLRTKKGVENSFESPDRINEIDWSLKTKNDDVFQYVKALIAMRKKHPSFRMRTGDEVARFIHFGEHLPGGVVAFGITGYAEHDSWKKIFVAYNGNGSERMVKLPNGRWNVFVFGNKVNQERKFVSGLLGLKPYSCTILYTE